METVFYASFFDHFSPNWIRVNDMVSREVLLYLTVYFLNAHHAMYDTYELQNSLVCSQRFNLSNGLNGFNFLVYFHLNFKLTTGVKRSLNGLKVNHSSKMLKQLIFIDKYLIRIWFLRGTVFYFWNPLQKYSHNAFLRSILRFGRRLNEIICFKFYWWQRSFD